MCEDLNVCHKFMTEVVPFIGLFSQRRLFIVDYSVCDEEFVIKVNYDKDQFEHSIHEYVCKILEDLKKSNLHRYCRAAGSWRLCVRKLKCPIVIFFIVL